jgi:hypothetical protein
LTVEPFAVAVKASELVLVLVIDEAFSDGRELSEVFP